MKLSIEERMRRSLGDRIDRKPVTYSAEELHEGDRIIRQIQEMPDPQRTAEQDLLEANQKIIQAQICINQIFAYQKIQRAKTHIVTELSKMKKKCSPAQFAVEEDGAIVELRQRVSRIKMDIEDYIQRVQKESDKRQANIRSFFVETPEEMARALSRSPKRRGSR